MIRGREVTSREVVQAHLDRIEAVNPHLNAIVRVLPDQALSAADAADKAVADGARLGPLHGVPFTVKENIDLAGTPTTQGVPALAEAVARVDAPAVDRLRRTGAIPVGRTNLPDFGLRAHTDSALHGLTANPWNPERSAGGSSGGDAVAVATGMSPLGLGTVLLSPVWSQPAFPVDFDIASLDNAIATLELMRPVFPASLLGTPAVVVPAGMVEGLPVGVQVMGGRYTDLRCLAVAELIEQRLGPLTPIDRREAM